MKKIIIVMATLALAGCASAKKQATPAPQTQAQTKVAPHSTPAADPKVQDSALQGGIVACKKGDEARQLEVIKKEAGCALNYTKGGKTSAAASSAHGTKHCVSSQDKIRKKLEKSGFTCA